MEYIIAKMRDKIRLFEKTGKEIATFFLTPAEVQKVIHLLKDYEYTLMGGYQEAERRIMVVGNNNASSQAYLAVIRVENTQKILQHRSVLGSILGLGIKREMIGDIIIKEMVCDILVIREMKEYILNQLHQIGNQKVTVHEVALEELLPWDNEKKMKNVTVASLRVDAMISACFDLAREKSAILVTQEKVLINFIPCRNVAKAIKEGDMISVRGYGRMKVKEIVRRNEKRKNSCNIRSILKEEESVTEIEKKVLNNSNMIESYLSPYACKSRQAVRLVQERRKNEFNVRNEFSRDADRIMHSTAYTRYMDKTQVFSLFNNDLITHRGLHVQFVAKIARTIGRALKLNEDLIEAIALGHDLGHVPFGHTGERYLSHICERNNLGVFHHNVQSVRVLQELEKHGKGLNITVQVLDGILCHNGEILSKKYVPDFQKTMEDFQKEYVMASQEHHFDKTIRPMTLEGCVVRISDIIAYIGRDVEDAIKVKLIERKDLPSGVVEILGDTNATIIDRLVEDLIIHSYDKPYLEFSNEKYKALKRLLEFNYNHIYSNPKKEDREEKYRGLFEHLYEALRKDLQNKRGRIYEYYKEMNQDYTKSNSSDKIIVDFVAGMTDKFFIHQYQEAFLPKTFNLTVDE